MAGSDDEIYRKYAEELVRFAGAVVGPDDAGDVVSVAVVRALRSPRWSEVTEHRAYLYRSVLNEARMLLRRERTRRHYEARASEPEHVREMPTPRPEVMRALRALSVRQRAVIYLTYWEDLDPAAIGRLLGITDGAVRRHLTRARKHLRKELQ